MGISFLIKDAGPARTHHMTFLAVKVEFTPDVYGEGPKIGTVVIIDLRIDGVPRDLPIVASIDAVDVVLQTGPSWWTVYNAAGESYTGAATEFYLSIKAGEMKVHL